MSLQSDFDESFLGILIPPKYDIYKRARPEILLIILALLN